MIFLMNHYIINSKSNTTNDVDTTNLHDQFMIINVVTFIIRKNNIKKFKHAMHFLKWLKKFHQLEFVFDNNETKKNSARVKLGTKFLKLRRHASQ